jgi:hypothetical protein
VSYVGVWCYWPLEVQAKDAHAMEILARALTLLACVRALDFVGVHAVLSFGSRERGSRWHGMVYYQRA